MTYTANSLNQYSQRTIPGAVDILGSAQTNATVTLNGGSVTRHGKYWYKNLGVTNTGNAVYQNVSVMGIYNPPGTNDPDVISTASGHVFVAKTPEAFTHDDDGNQLSDGRFNYGWDTENRLIGAETLSTLPASVPRKKLEFTYDYMSRRVSKTVSQWNSSSNAYQVSSFNQFVYDGWNLIQELRFTASSRQTNSYTWGLDLSGTLQGAGGIGGLVSVTRSTSSGTATYFPCYDGNGNITDYVDTNGVVVAHREYDAFGNTIVATGPMVNDFSFWFSTKYLDQETGLYYYGYRYYSPGMGRWLSRDPIGEEGGINLFYFTGNNPLNFADKLGLIFNNMGKIFTRPFRGTGLGSGGRSVCEYSFLPPSCEKTDAFPCCKISGEFDGRFWYVGTESGTYVRGNFIQIVSGAFASFTDAHEKRHGKDCESVFQDYAPVIDAILNDQSYCKPGRFCCDNAIINATIDANDYLHEAKAKYEEFKAELDSRENWDTREYEYKGYKYREFLY